MTIRLLAISGSLRRDSYNTRLLRIAERHAPAGVEVEFVDLREIPMYDQDVERDHGFPVPVDDLKRRIEGADGLLVATPEYNHSIPGVLKNALDWASRPYGRSSFLGKPVGMLGAGGGSGTRNAQRHLREVLTAIGADVLDAPEVLVAGAWNAFDGDELADETMTQRIVDLVSAVAAAAGERGATDDATDDAA